MSKSDGYLSQIHLGSNGHLYGGLLPDGLILSRPWTATEEMLIGSQINSNILLDKLITQTCQLPEGLKAEDLSTSDRFQIFFHQRNQSYPRPYDFNFKCSECGEKAHASIDLGSLEVRYLGLKTELDDLTLDTIRNEDGSVKYSDVDFTYPIPVELPLKGDKLTWRFLTGTDEKKIERYEKQIMSKNPKAQGDVGYLYRLAIRIVSVNDAAVNISEAMEYLRALVGEDLLVLRESFEENQHGLIPEVEPVCNHCQYPNGPFMLPFDASFFRPTRIRGDRP